MAIMREFRFDAKDLSEVLRGIQMERYGEDSYWIDGVYETWEGSEHIAERYGIEQGDDGTTYIPLDPFSYTRQMREDMLDDVELAPYIECVRERELPASRPGAMYNVGGGVPKSYSEVTWHDRIERQCSLCKNCQGTEYRGEPFFPLVVEEDDGSISMHWVGADASGPRWGTTSVR